MANQDYSISSEGQAFNASGTTTLAVSAASGNVALPSSDKTVVVQNTGSVTAYVFIAAGSGTVATTSNTPVLAGDTVVLSAGIGGTYLAAITSSSTTNLTITTGQGIPLLLNALNVTIGQVTANPPTSGTFTATQVTVPATANGILVLASNTSRKGATISNPGSVTVYISQASTGLTTSNGFGIPPGSSYNIDSPLYTGAIYGIVSTSTQVVTVVELT